MLNVSSIKDGMYNYLLGKNNPNSPYYAYHQILKTIPKNSKILDIGCGTGIYFDNPDVIDIIIKNNLNIVGIDIDEDSVNICRDRLKENKIETYITCRAENFLDISETYDYIFFIESFPVIDIPLFNRMFDHAKTLTNNIVLFHNLVKNKNPLLTVIKPYIKYITLIDMGRLTSFNEMVEYLDDKDCNNYSITKSYQCNYKDLHPILNLPYINKRVSCQYTINITFT